MAANRKSENYRNRERNTNTSIMNSEQVNLQKPQNYHEINSTHDLTDNQLEFSCQKNDNFDEKENKKLYPTQPTCDSRDRSESIRMYLNHNNLKREIEDLEVKEQRSSMKHLWDETLRFRNMRNRLELSGAKQIYQKHDWQNDSESKEEAFKHLETRTKQLEDRESVCADSGMYSEEAKHTWDQWMKEDQKSLEHNFNDLKDILLEQLEEEWLGLTEKDKKKIFQTHNQNMTDASMHYEMQLLAKRGIR